MKYFFCGIVSLLVAPLLLAEAPPYFTGFEEDQGFSPGEFQGQDNWIVFGLTEVSGAKAFEGDQSLSFFPGASESVIRKQLERAEPIVYLDFFIRINDAAGDGKVRIDLSDLTVGAEGAQSLVNGFFFGPSSGPVSRKYSLTDLAVSGWIRVTLRADFPSGLYDLWLGGKLVAFDLPFKSIEEDLMTIRISRHGDAVLWVDDFYIGGENPLFADQANDGLPDTFKSEHGLSLDEDCREYLIEGEPAMERYFEDMGLEGSPYTEEGAFLSELPFFEDFESRVTGAIAGQDGWFAEGNAFVSDGMFNGGRALSIEGDSMGEGISHAEKFFVSERSPETWTSFLLKPVAGQLPLRFGAEENPGAALGVGPDGVLYAFDGSLRLWKSTGISADGEVNGLKIDVRLRYPDESWDLCVGGVMVLRDLGIDRAASSSFTRFKIEQDVAGAAHLDLLSISLDEPPNLDFSGDGMTNDEKRALGLDIYKTDTTGDGLPDWWLVEQGLDPLDPAIGQTDPDADGLTVVEEYRLGTDPTNSDTDGDGWNDFDEHLAGTDPFDPGSAPDAANFASWEQAGINERRAGGAYRVGDEYRIVSDARDLTGTDDGLRFVHQEVTGDFEFSARVNALENVFPWSQQISWTARAGLMARESLAPNSRYVVTSMTPRAGFFFRGRQYLGDISTFNIQRNWASPFPSWVKLKRRGNEFTGYRSYDGENWVTVGSWTMSLPETLYLGMMASSGHIFQFARGRFDDVRLELGSGNPGYWEEPNLEGSLIETAVLTGASFVASSGKWQVSGNSVFSREIRGSLEYQVTTNDAGAYVLEVEGRQSNPHAEHDRFSLVIKVNGQETGRPTLVASGGEAGSVQVFLPYLPAGAHLVEIEWRNGLPNTFLQVDAIRLLRVDGDDADGNGLADWFDDRLATLSHVDEEMVESFVSPFPLEGRSYYLGMLDVLGYSPPGEAAEFVTVRPALEGHFYADVPLAPGGSTDILVSEQGGAIDYVKPVSWRAVNILNFDEEEFTIRRGDAMRFTATNANFQADPHHVIAIDVAPVDGLSQVESFTATANTPVVIEFDTDGDYLVAGQAAESDDPDNNGYVLVRVRGVEFGSSPAATIGHVRNWSIPYAAEEARFEWDSHVFLNQVQINNTARHYDLSVRDDRDGHVIARLGDDGPIMGTVLIQAVRDDSFAHTTSLRVVEKFSDGSIMVEGVIVLGAVPDDLEIHLRIFRAGVLFDDGTIDRIVTADDFDEFGRYRYRMVQSVDTIGAACHTIDYFQGGEQISFR